MTEKEGPLNKQPNKELQYFQELICANYTVKKYRLWLDEQLWENEKKARVIELKEEEIKKLNAALVKKSEEINALGNKLNEVTRKFKELSSPGKLVIRKGKFPR